MISIYSENNTNYENNGDATLVPIKCDLELNINGSWQLSLEHPYDEEERYKYIVEGAVIQADVLCVEELTVTKQRFRIYNYSKNLHSVSAIAFPIAMESTYDAPVDNVVFDNQSGTQVFAKLQEYSNKYTFTTNISARKSASYSNTNVNEIIAGNEGFIETWGGEIVYDNLNYKVLAEIGDENAGFRIEYGKNLTDIEYEVDDSGLATRLYPISNDKIRLNGNGYVESARASDYPVVHSRFIDTPYTLIDDDLLSPSRTAQQTRASQSAISTSANTTSHSAYTSALNAGYQPDYIKYIKDDIISAIITMSLSGIVSEKFYNLASKTITDAMAWLGNLEQPAWEWITRQGWYYGTNNADGSMKNYAVNQYIYSYSEGKWYHFAESGLMDYDQSQMSQETIDLLNTYDWHTDENGQYYGDGVSGSGNFFKNAWIENSNGTHSWVGADGYYVAEKDDSEAWAWTQLDGWMYGESLTRYAKNEYVEIDKNLEYFGDDGYWHDWERVKADEMGWYQVNDATSPHNGKWWYGSKGRNYAHNEFIYVKVDGQWKEWWYDEKGWYDESSSGDSSYDWHGDATSGYWFGEEDATTEDKSKYLHDCWAYIDDGTSEFGTYYWFNSNGYISGDATLAKRDWAWGDITDEVTGKHWFGNRDTSFNRVWISNQWLEIDGKWYYFDANGYVVSENTSKANAIAVFTSGMAALTTTVNTEKTNLYNLLYDLMTEYCEKCYAEGMDLPAITISVNLADLSNTVEYTDFADLEKVKLGDSVLVIDAERNIEYTSRVVGLTYDCINQYNANVIIGKPSASIQQIVGNASGTPVSAGGIDTTALEAQLSTKISDVRYKGSSLVNNGVAILDNVGTKVIANPEGTPTTELTKLRVEDVIYKLAEGGAKVTYGTANPSGGSDGNVYLQIDESYEAPFELYTQETLEVTESTDTSITINGTTGDSSEYVCYKLAGLTVGQTYTISFSAQLITAVTYYGASYAYGAFFHDEFSYVSGVSESYYTPFVRDNNSHSYTTSFIATGERAYFWVQTGAITNGNAIELRLTNIAITPYPQGIFESAVIKDIWLNDKGTWVNSDFSGNVTDVEVDGISNVINGVAEFYSYDGINKGLVTPPATTGSNRYFKEDGTWDTPGGGGGSSVIANPTGTPTDTLNTVEIDNVIYEIVGGGSGGSGYEETVLWDAGGTTSRWADPITATLNDSLRNYDEIRIRANTDGSSEGAILVIPTSEIPSDYSAYYFENAGYRILYANADSDTQVSLYTSTGVTLTYTKIVGVKYGGGSSSIKYSTEEQVIGEWIDGKPLYQKTVVKTVTTQGNATISVADEFPSECTFRELIGIVAYTYSGTYYTNSEVKPRRVGTVNNIILSIGSATNTYEITFTAKYTKTTD